MSRSARTGELGGPGVTSASDEGLGREGGFV